MLQEILSHVSAHPLVTTTTGIGAVLTSEILGFTKKGGILKTLADLVVALGRVIGEMRKEAMVGTPEKKDQEG